MSKTQSRWILFSGRALASVVMFTVGGLLHAQTPRTNQAAPTANVAAQEPILNLQTSVASGDGQYSSSEMSAGNLQSPELASNTPPAFHFFNAMQYGGGRQRYGRPKYHGGNTNPDGSPKYDFFVGGGFNMPEGTQSNYLTTGWGFGAGGGRMFNAHVGVNLEFNYDHFGMTQSTINNYAALYGDPTNSNGFGANSHVWSFSLQPIYNIRSGEGIGAYVTGGVGFYHKVANFTLPETGCDPNLYYYYGECFPVAENVNIDHYTSNAPGFDGGFGLTYKFSRFTNERLYAEVRYVYVANQYKAGLTTANENTYAGFNYFPQNSQHTSYIPVKFGLRF